MSNCVIVIFHLQITSMLYICRKLYEDREEKLIQCLYLTSKEVRTRDNCLRENLIIIVLSYKKLRTIFIFKMSCSSFVSFVFYLTLDLSLIFDSIFRLTQVFFLRWKIVYLIYNSKFKNNIRTKHLARSCVYKNTKRVTH